MEVALDAIVYVARGRCDAAGLPEILEAVACLARSGWSHLMRSDELTGDMTLGEGLLALTARFIDPDKTVDTQGYSRKAVIHAALSAAIECGKVKPNSISNHFSSNLFQL